MVWTKVNPREVFYTGDPAAQHSQHYVDKDGVAYTLLFCESVKSVDAEFYKEHVGACKLYGYINIRYWKSGNLCNRSKRREYEEN